MAKRELVGLTDCPECGFTDAEVRPDKSDSLYRFCPGCTSQYFTRGNDVKTANLLKKTRKVNQDKVVESLKATGAVAKDKLKPVAPVPPVEPPTPPARKAWAPLIG